MEPLSDSAFDLPDHLAAKADPMLVAGDEQHFAELAAALQETTVELSARLEAARRSPGGAGQAAMERDLEVHRLTARLRALRRYGLDVCLGRIDPAGEAQPVYVGRLGLTARDGRRLLVDWRSPAAEPFFGATHAEPMGLASRRRYRWAGGRVSDYWDEAFTPEAFAGHAAALDDQSAFLASLGGTRSARMRDVLGTIAADQDAIVRAGSRGALVVDGGPGTGKTVVALHRTAYLLYSDPRLGHRTGGVLFVGPHEPYLAYVSDVLPSLGEEGVQTCTLRDLVPEGTAAMAEADPRVAGLKASPRLVEAVEAAVRFYEEAPTATTTVETPWGEVDLDPAGWRVALDAPDPGIPHNEAREQVWEALVDVVLNRLGDGEGGHDDAVDSELLRTVLERDDELGTTFNRAWPVIDPTDLVGDLWTVPAYLRLCAPWLGADEVRLLRRADPAAWTVADLPLLDAARHRLGDPDAPARARRSRAVAAAEREQLGAVIDDLIAADDDREGLVTMLRHPDIRSNLADPDAVPRADPDLLAGPFAHVVVDEAQELTDAEWQMVLRRCPSRSLTIVGDRAQARHGFAESWEERLARVGLHRVARSTLGINYRTPAEVMAEAEPVIRAVLPDANVPTSIRSTGLGVVHGSTAELRQLVDGWLDTHADGVACVVGHPSFAARPRVRCLSPELAKGLEFDLVVLVDPESFGTGVTGAVDRYVSMSRATSQLVVLTSP